MQKILKFTTTFLLIVLNFNIALGGTTFQKSTIATPVAVTNGGTGLTSITQGYTLFSSASNTLSATSNIFVEAGGNVGIGTTVPAGLLDVRGTLCLNGGADCRTTWPSTDTNIWTVTGSNTYYSTGNVGIGTQTPGNKLAVTPTQYSTGTASQALTTVTGVGTTFTSAMVGSQLVYTNGTNGGTITAFTNTTTLTVSTSQTVSAQAYDIAYTGLQVDSTGKVGVGTTAPVALFQINQSIDTPEGGISLGGKTGANNRFQTFVDSSDDLNFRWAATGVTPMILADGGNVIMNGGNVGIGTTAPNYKLQLHDSASTASWLQFTDNTTGTSNVNGAVIGISGSQKAQFWNYGNTDMQFATNATARMTIQAGGNVGIGTTAPGTTLHLGAGGAQLRFGATSNGYDMGRDNSSGQFWFNATQASPYNEYRFKQGGIDKLVIDSSGNVGIGTTAPSSLLTLKASVLDETDGIRLIGSQGLDALLMYPSGDNVATIESKIDAGQTAGILLLNPSGGNVGIGTTAPGVKLHVQSASAGATALRLTDAVRGTLDVDFPATSQVRMGVGAAEDLIFSSGGTSTLFLSDINSGGNVGIGTTAPVEKLQVDGDIKVGGTTNKLYYNTDLTYIGSDTVNELTLQGYEKLTFSTYNDAGDKSIIFSPKQTEAMRINSSGNVGIGTTNPESLLHVNGTSQFEGIINTNGNWISGDGGAEGLSVATNGNVGIGTTAPTQKLEIIGSTLLSAGGIYKGKNGAGTSLNLARVGANDFFLAGDQITVNQTSGNVGIGTTAPKAKLDVSAITYGNNQAGGIRIGDTGGNWDYNLFARSDNSGIPRFSIGYGTTETFVISTGNVGIGTTAPGYTLTVNGTAWVTSGAWSGSDKRWKQDITPLNNSLDKVLSLEGVSYNWRKEEFPELNFTDGLQLGLIAQDVEKIIPEVVTTGEDGYKGISYEKLVPVLTEAIQELKTEKDAEIEELKSTNDELKIEKDFEILELKTVICELKPEAEMCLNR